MFARSLARAATVAGALALVAGAPAIAQDMAPEGQQQEPPTVDVSDEELENFVSAWNEVNGLQQEYQQEIMAAETDEDRVAIEQEAQEELVAAVEGEGLTVDEYNQIVQAAAPDTELYDRIMEMSEQTPQ